MSVNIYDAQNDALNQIAGREDTSFWEGTQAQWKALSSADRALWTGKYVIITDDEEDASTATVTFTSNDVANTDTSKTDSGWTDTAILTSGEPLSSIFNKVSNMFKNIRRLWNTVGTTEIPSGLGNTVTGAIDTLNTNCGNNIKKSWTVSINNNDWQTWGNLYSYTFTANPQGDYRDKRIEYEFVSTNGYACFVTLDKVTETSLEFTLMRPTVAVVTGRITARVYSV